MDNWKSKELGLAEEKARFYERSLGLQDSYVKRLEWSDARQVKKIEVLEKRTVWRAQTQVLLGRLKCAQPAGRAAEDLVRSRWLGGGSWETAYFHVAPPRVPWSNAGAR